MDHPTLECTKTFDASPRCLHCLGDHTENYKGCRVYQDLVSKRVNRQTVYPNNRRSANFMLNNNEYPQLNGIYRSEPQQNINQQNVNQLSYSEALKTSQSNFNARLEKLENLMENFMNMMTMIMTKLCKLI